MKNNKICDLDLKNSAANFTDFTRYWRSLNEKERLALVYEINSSGVNVSYNTLRRIGKRKTSPMTAIAVEKATGFNKSYLRPDLWSLDE